jgi:nucleotide-binding universal stress UspA family protein
VETRLEEIHAPIAVKLHPSSNRCTVTFAEENGSMDTCIVVATEGSPESVGPLRMAGWLAVRDGYRVEVLSVYDSTELYAIGYPEIAGSAPPQIAPLRIEALRARVLSQLTEVGGAATEWPVTVNVGRVAATIARFAAKKHAGLILLGLRQPGGVERWFGRESLLRLVHLAHVPVLAVPSVVSELPRRVIVAVDFSEYSLRAAHEVMQWVAHGARLHLVHVAWDAGQGEDEAESLPTVSTYRAGAERRLEELAKELEQAGTVDLRVHVLSGDPGTELVRLAEEIDADLIAVGSHGAGFFGRIVMGSVSSKLAHGSRCSLFIVPPREPSKELLQLTERELLAGLGTAGDLALSGTPSPAE